MKELVEDLKALIITETNRSDETHPPVFNTAHEAYATILEEYEEARDELDFLYDALDDYWQNIKNNNKDEQHDTYLQSIQIKALLAAAECIQIAVCAIKARRKYTNG